MTTTTPDRARLEELLGEYWEIAFEESSGVAATGNKANRVLHEIRALFYALAAPDELEQLRKDAERVAWYENNPEKVLNIGFRWYSRNGYGLPMKRRKGFREAIDAAMKETP